MQLRSKIFLVLAILLGALDYTPVVGEKLYGIPLPMAVVCFGLFLITWMLPRKDLEQFEKDQALRQQMLKGRPSRDKTDAPLAGWDRSSKRKDRPPPHRPTAASMSHR